MAEANEEGAREVGNNGHIGDDHHRGTADVNWDEWIPRDSEEDSL